MADWIPQGTRPGVCCGRILLTGLYLDELNAYYTNTLRVATLSTGSPESDPDFDLNNYGLIVCVMPETVPPWWEVIRRREWNPCIGPRRIHLVGEHDDFGNSSLAAINEMAGIFGMSLELRDHDCGCDDTRANPVYPHHLTVGMSRLHMACSSRVIGGTMLSKTVWGSPSIFTPPAPVDPSTPNYQAPGVSWLSAAAVDGMELVLSGDVNHLGSCTPNNRFYRNLWTVKIP